MDRGHGAASVLAGVIAVVWPSSTLVVIVSPVSSLFFLTIFLGFWLVIFGVMLVVRGFGLRSATSEPKAMAPHPAA